ncbi:MAG: LptF/LptG family permease [Gemmatimonadetes bacterium]|nr:LptF/LptG family permease [Gemmatimonadota bacterium]
MRTLSRYVLREHLGPLVFAMSALTSLLLLNYIAKQLPQLVGKGLPWDVVVEFVVLSLPFTIAMTLPMAVLVATLHAFSRLAADSEITAFKASGLSLPRIMAPVVFAGLILSLAMVWFNDQVMPAANYALATLGNDIARKKPTFALRPQVINQVAPGSAIFLRAGHLEGGSSEMRDVTIYDFSDAAHRRTIRADSGHIELSPDGRDLILTLKTGFMNELSRTEPARLERVFFTTNLVRVRGIGNDLERNTRGGEKSDRERTVCELQAQLNNAVRTRDSIFAGIKSLDPPAARALGARTAVVGSGGAFCAAKRLFRVKTAEAATVAALAAQAGGPPPQAPPQAPAQAPAQAPVRTDSAPKSSAGMQVVTQNPAAAIPPSAGIVRTPAAGADEPLARPVLIESMKLQLAGVDAIVAGNQVEIEKKFAIATACVIFALLGAPIAFRFPRGGVGLTIGVSLAVFGVYYCGLLVGEELARRGYVHPFIAMWGTNAILLLIGVVLTARLGHEGTTHRGSEFTDQLGRLADQIRARFGRKTVAG